MEWSEYIEKNNYSTKKHSLLRQTFYKDAECSVYLLDSDLSHKEAIQKAFTLNEKAREEETDYKGIKTIHIYFIEET